VTARTASRRDGDMRGRRAGVPWLAPRTGPEEVAGFFDALELHEGPDGRVVAFPHLVDTVKHVEAHAARALA
jgi:hypothetical protein